MCRLQVRRAFPHRRCRALRKLAAEGTATFTSGAAENHRKFDGVKVVLIRVLTTGSEKCGVNMCYLMVNHWK